MGTNPHTSQGLLNFMACISMKGLWLSQGSHAPIYYPDNRLDFTEGYTQTLVTNLDTLLQLLINHCGDPPESTETAQGCHLHPSNGLCTVGLFKSARK